MTTIKTLLTVCEIDDLVYALSPKLAKHDSTTIPY